MLFNRPRRRRNFFRQAQLAPYQARRFKNPFFQSPIKKPKWPFIIAGVTIGLTVALTSFFFTAPIFKITSVRVEGVETVNPKIIRDLTDNYLSSRAWLIFNHRNRFLFNKTILQTKLEKNMSFSSLQINREGQTLAIIIKEKSSSFLWQTGDDSYLLDDTGTVIRTISIEELAEILKPPSLQGPTPDGKPLPEPTPIVVVKDLTDKLVTINQSLLSSTEVKNLRLFFETLKNNQIYIKNFELNRDVGSWLKSNTVENYSILFDPGADVQAQIDNLLLILREQIKDISKLEYVDVRFGNRVYYK